MNQAGELLQFSAGSQNLSFGRNESSHLWHNTSSLLLSCSHVPMFQKKDTTMTVFSEGSEFTGRLIALWVFVERLEWFDLSFVSLVLVKGSWLCSYSSSCFYSTSTISQPSGSLKRRSRWLRFVRGRKEILNENVWSFEYRSAASVTASCPSSSWTPASSDPVRWRPCSPVMRDNLASAPITWRLLCSHQQWRGGVLPIHLLLNPRRTEPNSRER